MTWLREQIASSPHLLDPAQTRNNSRAYALRWYTRAELMTKVADHQRAIKHEQAILDGMCDALNEMDKKQHA